MAHDGADPDAAKRHRQRGPAALATEGVDEPSVRQFTDDLAQVVVRNAEYRGHLGCGHPPVRVQGEVDQGAQPEIGVFGQLHGGRFAFLVAWPGRRNERLPALTAVVGPGLLLTGAVGLFIGWAYLVRPLRLGAPGLGELNVGLGFGVEVPLGAAYVQLGHIDTAALWAGLPFAFLVALVLYVSQFPDLRADAASGKRNWVARLGAQDARVAYPLLTAGPAPRDRGDAQRHDAARTAGRSRCRLRRAARHRVNTVPYPTTTASDRQTAGRAYRSAPVQSVRTR